MDIELAKLGEADLDMDKFEGEEEPLGALAVLDGVVIA